uniref:Anaphase-promoting complex subunit 4 n=1 Tax=Scleropages formosus TaxID=113540 RepID=A0A8C9T3J6_SCLFO
MPAFHQVGEKQLPNAVLFMAWSPKRDLIALANKAGELLLHRLANFQRVWSLAPNENTGKEVTALAWRPDGKILSFSLADTRKVVLCDAEKAEILHLFPVENAVSCMQWMDVLEESSLLTSFYNAEDESSLFLPKLPTLPKSEDKSDEVMNLLGEARLNILVLGGHSGFMELYAYGMYRIATVTGVPGTCRSLCLSSDLRSLSVVTEVRSADEEPEINYIQLDTALLSDCLPEVTRMARKFTHISTLLQYLRLSLTCMCEAWEDILMQMDLRLTKFVQEKNTSTQVQDEFLELLLWGKSSIQKLVISHLQSGSEALLYHLSEVKGMSLWKQKFEPLGLDAAAIEALLWFMFAIICCSFCCRVIDKSMKNFKAFFRWLYVAMLRMSEDHVPPELNKMTQKDIAFVADFLAEHFSENEELFDRKGKYFNVERVGQYLKDEDEDLVSPPNTKGNQWLNFLQESTHLKESPLLFPSFPQKSLHYVKRMMEGAIELCLQNPAVSDYISVYVRVYTHMAENTPGLFELPSLWNDKKGSMHYMVFVMPQVSPCLLYLMRRHTDPHRYMPAILLPPLTTPQLNSLSDQQSAFVHPCSSRYSCLDARIYDDETLTVVLQQVDEEEGNGRVLAQLPLGSALSCEEPFTWDPTQRLEQQASSVPAQVVLLENQWRLLENMKAQYVAVNGVRRVACVLSSNLRHVRVFEMDVEDEEDDERLESPEASAEQEQLDESLASQGDEGLEAEVAAGEALELPEEQEPTVNAL